MSYYFSTSFASSSTITSTSSIKPCRKLGRKCLQDRIDRIPSMADQHISEDWEHWSELFENDSHCMPIISDQLQRDERELKDVQERLKKRGLNQNVRRLSVGRRICLSRLPSCEGLIQPGRQ
ncbi:hypothetical protein FIBSPDRAFT_852668 [Athelia psychrophila]|uniref:Uncharacterized protein n=1 Tax=Athelia psychrophila TaxID=1759441 RepID=A0A166RQ32_9AGAM|nr:hypothetical protein FIBSPDRAFT_852668 [Fibularhizoctonia sp. CBS 109695]